MALSIAYVRIKSSSMMLNLHSVLSSEWRVSVVSNRSMDPALRCTSQVLRTQGLEYQESLSIKIIVVRVSKSICSQG
jgi:hypothetical protein